MELAKTNIIENEHNYSISKYIFIIGLIIMFITISINGFTYNDNINYSKPLSILSNMKPIFNFDNLINYYTNERAINTEITIFGLDFSFLSIFSNFFSEIYYFIEFLLSIISNLLFDLGVVFRFFIEIVSQLGA